jgi:hypothetical protein
MDILSVAFAIGATAMSPSLQAVLDGFSGRATPEQRQLVNAVSSSTPLASQLNALIEAHRLTAIRLAPVDQKAPGPFGAWQAEGVIYLTAQFLQDQTTPVRHAVDYSRNNPNSLVYALGHIAYHLQSESQAKCHNAMKSLESASFAQTPPGESPDLTAAVHDNDGKPLPLRDVLDQLLKFRYLYLFDAAMKGQTKSVLLSDGSISDDEHNVTAFVHTFGTQPVADIQ